MRSDYLEQKSETCNLIKLLSHGFGVELTDEDIYQILLSFELINHDILADERYQLLNISPLFNEKILSLLSIG